MRWWQRKNEFNCCRGIADSTKLQDRAISWPPENLLIELLTGIVTTVNVNTINQAGAEHFTKPSERAFPCSGEIFPTT